MFSTDDSIVAIATPPGRGGIGVVRISGPTALDVAHAILESPQPLEPRRATFTRARGENIDAALDEVVATYFPEPHSYTGQHVVEISAHGSPVVLRAIVASAIAAGARLARPGEFTLRSFLNGKRDLIQAEAVADLIEAATPLQARVAFDQLEGTLTERIAAVDEKLFTLIALLEASLDFPDEGYHFVDPAGTGERIDEVTVALDALLGDARRGRMIREGTTVAIVGRPNVGKSSIFNALAAADRAIVTAVAGTTRDLVTEVVDIEGLAVTLVDTAGWRDTIDVVEQEGVARATKARAAADLLLVVVDQSVPLAADDERLLGETEGRTRVVLGNKADLPSSDTIDDLIRRGVEVMPVSAVTHAGVDCLRRKIVHAMTGGEPARETAAVSNARHVELLEAARASLVAARVAATIERAPEEFVLTHLQAARERFDEVVGRRTSEDVLRHIFERFCIGK